jgi:hypothetical protein
VNRTGTVEFRIPLLLQTQGPIPARRNGLMAGLAGEVRSARATHGGQMERLENGSPVGRPRYDFVE